MKHSLSLVVAGALALTVLTGQSPMTPCTKAWGQALPPGQEEEAAVAKKPPFAGLGLDVSAWDSTGLWGGGGAYRNDLGIMLIPTWSLGKRYIGHGPFKSLSLQARFFFNVPIVGFDSSNFDGQPPPAGDQQPCFISAPNSELQIRSLPRCDWGRTSRRVDYGDLTLVLANPRIYQIPKIKVNIDPSVILTLPVSAQSRLRTLVLTATPQVGVSRGFWKGRFSAAYTFGLGLPFFIKATPDIINADSAYSAAIPYSQDVLNTGLSSFYDTQATSMLCFPGEPCRNPFLSMAHTVRATVQIIEPLSLTVIYRITSTGFKNPQNCPQQLPWSMIQDDPCARSVRLFGTPEYFWRDGQLLWIALNYQALPWLGINLAYITSAPLWQYERSDPENRGSTAIGDGSQTRHYRQGFISVDGNAFTSVNLGLDITVEALAQKFMRKK